MNELFVILFQDKMSKLKARMRNVRMEQNGLKSNLSKFNTFVREKELKAMKGVRYSCLKSSICK
jgi:hypothetical protein